MNTKVMPSSRRVRVLMVVGNGIVGGMESVVARLAERLPRDVFHVTALCPYEGAFSARLRSVGVDCQVAPMPEDPPWSVVQTMCALVQAHNIDVLHAHLPNAHLLAGLVGKLTGRPVLATIHGRQLMLVDLEVHRATGTHLCAVCRHSELHALGVGVDPARLNCVPNGVDTALFAPAAAAAAAAAAANDAPRAAGVDGTPHGVVTVGGAPHAIAGPRIGFVGRLSHEKGPEVFIRMALLLRDRLPTARFVLIGDGPMRPVLQAMLVRHRLTGRVQIAGVRDDMPAAYRELDVLVSSSHSEAMPLAVMEGMASALPVVATRVGAVPDLIEHGGTGWLTEPGNSEGLADWVAHLCGRPAERAAMGAAGRARMVSRFGLERSVEATGQLLLRLVQQNTAAADKTAARAMAPALHAVEVNGTVAARQAPTRQ